MFSMTGYTKRDFKINDLGFSIIIKSLNSTKGLDISIKTPRYLFDLEPEIKKLIDKFLIRGKIDFRIIEFNHDKQLTLDLKKLKRHIKMLKKFLQNLTQVKFYMQPFLYSQTFLVLLLLN